MAVTDMVSYADLAQAENPSLSTAFSLVGAEWAVVVIFLGSLIGLARVMMAMSRDGVFPPALSKPSDKRGTPARTQIISGFSVPPLAGFSPVELLSEMIMGSLSAFVMVSIGILVLRHKRPDPKPAVLCI